MKLKINKNNEVKINNFKITNVLFKNQANVSESDKTNELGYLYHISESSASSVSNSSSSLSNIINSNIQKQIYNSIKTYFIGGTNFQVTWAFNVGTIQMNLTGNPYPELKFKAEYKFIKQAKSSSSSSASSSNCSDSSSSSSSHCKPNKYIKILVIACIFLLVGHLLIRKHNKNNNLLSESKCIGLNLMNKVKKLF